MEHAPFVHLHTHSEYSILDGAAKIDDLIRKAQSYKMPALALTDHGNMFGAFEFYEKATCGGVKPILGEEFYLSTQSMKKKDKGEKPYHLILLARDEEGYRNLLYLSSMAYLEGFYYKPRIDKELLSSHSKGLIGLSSCLGGEIPTLLGSGMYDEAKIKAREYIDIFGKDDFYLEIMDNGLAEQRKINGELLKLSEEVGIKVVATNDIHYLGRDDAEYHDVLLCIQTGKTIDETRRLKFKTNEFYFRSPEEMTSLFAQHPEAIKNTLEITEKCNLMLDIGTFHLPHFPIPQGFTADAYLEKLTEEGLNKRYRGLDDKIKSRAKMELDVIKSMGFSTYFLIVWDFISYAKGRGISVGPGRGSAAGSIVSYALGITDVDPLKYGLLFERFLNVSRISMPDIDIDFDGERRDEVIDYVRKKYGEDRVAQIITFGAMKAKAVVRDVARALDIPLKDADTIAKMIPYRHNITIEEALNTNKELDDLVQKSEKFKRLFEISTKLEKLVRHPSTHAAGVVISPEPLTELVPLYKDAKSGVISTQYQAKNLEDAGLIKVDFLGLKSLTVMERCLKEIENAGLKVPDIQYLDLEDRNVYELLSKGKSIGVFQLESSGMQGLLKRLIPNRFDDIIAVLALYRPGPLDSGMVDEFIERKHGRKPPTYPHPMLEEVLKETHGVILYQEQVMEIARIISGFTMAEADNLRKAMGKKKPEILEEAREKFIDGALKRKVDIKVAEEIFELIKTFGRYGFNKSHSTAYALLAFQTAYLKTYYPVYYLSSLLSGELNDTDKIAQYLGEAREMGVEVLPPHVNRSGATFTVQGNSIRYALSAIKNVGESASKNIVEQRGEGEYTSFIDFTSRVDLRLLNRRVIESLIKSGAMDGLGGNRKTLFENIDSVIERGTRVQMDHLTGQSNLFEEKEVSESESYYPMKVFDEWSEVQISDYEKEAMGFYFKAHPLLKFKEMMSRFGAYEIFELKELPSEITISIMGVINSSKRITTKDKKEMAFFTLADLTGTIEVVVFPSVFEKCGSYLDEMGVVVVTGRLNGEKIFADRILYPEEFEKEAVTQVHILLINPVDEEKLLRLRDIFIQNKGRCNVYLHTSELDREDKVIKASTFLLVEPNESFVSQLKREKLAKKVWVC